jgi:glycosyltransferase involved in cell wall biosynthesis
MKKRILYTDYSSGFGGSSTVLYDLLKNLNRNEYEPVVMVAREGHNFTKTMELGIEVIKADIHVIGMRPMEGFNYMNSLIIGLVFHLLPNIWKIRRIILNKKIDLVHVNNNIKHCGDVILAARLAGVPCVCHIRETQPVSRMDKVFGPFVKRIIVLNKTVYKNIKAVLSSKKTQIIPDGVDLDVVVNHLNVSNIKKQFGLEGNYCVGFLGRFVDGKGVDVLIHSAALVKKHHKNVRYLIVGDDPDKGHAYKNYLEKIVVTLNLKDEVIFTGWRVDKFDLISVMDVLVQPSSWAEGFGLTCIEAMALGKPVIATDVPGPADIIDHEKTGFLIPSNNPEAMAEAVIKLIENPPLSQSLAIAGKQSVEKKFNIKTKTKEIEEIYQEMMTKA